MLLSYENTLQLPNKDEIKQVTFEGHTFEGDSIIKFNFGDYDVFKLMGSDGKIISDKQIVTVKRSSQGKSILASPNPYFNKNNFEETPYLYATKNETETQFTWYLHFHDKDFSLKNLFGDNELKLHVNILDPDKKIYEFIVHYNAVGKKRKHISSKLGHLLVKDGNFQMKKFSISTDRLTSVENVKCFFMYEPIQKPIKKADDFYCFFKTSVRNDDYRIQLQKLDNSSPENPKFKLVTELFEIDDFKLKRYFVDLAWLDQKPVLTKFDISTNSVEFVKIDFKTLSWETKELY